MKISKIRIKNFKSIGGKWEEFEFPLSLNLINGEVGCGKTTVYSAITYVLYNKNTDFKGNSKSTLPVNRLINDINKKELLVEIELDNGYTIKRGQKPDVFEILKDGENLANKSVTVDQSFLENEVLGGMTLDIFLSTVYLSNKPGSTPFIHMTNAQRKEYIEKILDLRRLYYYNENLKKFIAENKMEKNSLDKEAQLVDETITNEEYNTRIQLQKQEEDKQRLQDYKDNYSKRLQEQETLIQDLNSELIKYQDELKDFKISEEDLVSFIKEIEQLDNELKQIDIEDNTIIPIKELKEQIQESTKIVKELSFTINMQETDLHDLKDSIKDEEDLLYNNLLKEIQENQDKLNKLGTIGIQKKADYDAYIKSKENYHFCGDCPKLSKIIGSYDIQSYEAFKIKMTETALNLKNTLDEQIKRKEQIEYSKKKNQKIKEDIQELSNKIDKNKSIEEVNKINIKNCTSKIEQIKLNKETEKELRKKGILEKKERVQEKKEQFIQEKKDEIQRSIDKIQSSIEYAQDKIEMIKNEQEPIVREVSTKYLEELKEKKEKIKERIDLEYNKSVDLEDLKKEINSPEHKVKAIKKYIPVFENKLNEILEIFMEDDVFDLRAKLSEEFELTFYKNGKEIPVFTLSSGQVACCSLACTFAFLYLLEVKHHNNFNHLLIDELLDLNIGTRIHKVLGYLKTIATNKNISVISHNKTLDVQLFDTITYVSKDDVFSKYTIS